MKAIRGRGGFTSVDARPRGTGASNGSRSFAAAAAAPAIKSRLNVARELGCVMCAFLQAGCVRCAGHGSNHAGGDKAKYRMAFTCTGGVSDKNGSAAAVRCTNVS
jgi:hypothetical protein